MIILIIVILNLKVKIYVAENANIKYNVEKWNMMCKLHHDSREYFTTIIGRFQSPLRAWMDPIICRYFCWAILNEFDWGYSLCLPLHDNFAHVEEHGICHIIHKYFRWEISIEFDWETRVWSTLALLLGLIMVSFPLRFMPVYFVYNHTCKQKNKFIRLIVCSFTLYHNTNQSTKSFFFLFARYWHRKHFLGISVMVWYHWFKLDFWVVASTSIEKLVGENKIKYDVYLYICRCVAGVVRCLWYNLYKFLDALLEWTISPNYFAFLKLTTNFSFLLTLLLLLVKQYIMFLVILFEFPLWYYSNFL